MKQEENTTVIDRLEFDAFVLDLYRRELLNRGRAVPLQPLVFDALAHFARNPGRVISKTELLESVWRSPYVTDSSIVRTVMKLRRTIGPLLTTVHGVGYRLDAPVRRLLPSPSESPLHESEQKSKGGSLAVLRIRDERQLAIVGNNEIALTEWLHFVLQISGIGPVLPMISVLASRPPHDLPENKLSTACQTLGSKTALACVVRDTNGRVGLEAVWGADDQSSTRLLFECDTLGESLSQLVLALNGTPMSGLATLACSDELMQVFLLESKDRVDQALNLFHRLVVDAPASPYLTLLQARLLRKRGDSEAARVAIEAHLESGISTSAPELNSEMLCELTKTCIEQADLASATRYSEMAMAALPLDSSHSSASGLLYTTSRVAMLKGDFAGALSLAARALDHALLSGDAAAILEAKHIYAATLALAGRTHEGLRLCQEACAEAASLGTPSVMGKPYFTLGSIHQYIFQHESALRCFRVAKGFINRESDVHEHTKLLAAEVDALLSTYRLDEGENVLNVLEGLSFEVGKRPFMIERLRAQLDRQRGDIESAASRYQQLLEEALSRQSPHRWLAGSLLLGCNLSLGRIDDAELLLERCGDDPHPWTTQHWDASIALVKGDRPRSRELRTSIWLRHAAQDRVGIENALNLAWMLLEDGSSIDPKAVFWRTIGSMSDEYVCVQLVRMRLLHHFAPKKFDAALWADTVRSCPGLNRRNEWLADFGNIRLEASRLLSEPLCNACL